MMTQTATRRQDRRPSVGARRFGYTVAVAINVLILYAANRWPGWEVVPFLTSDTERVMDLVNASIVVNIVANIVYLLRDPRWLKALGDVVTTSVGIVALVEIWRVFPVDFDGSGWETLVRILLAVGILGSAIAIVGASASFVKGLGGRRGP